MGHKAKPSGEGPGAPIWMVSFTDSMTNLLTFFILLITFAAFGNVGSGGARGAGPWPGGGAMPVGKTPPKEGILPPRTEPGQSSPQGSEKPYPAEEFAPVIQPRPPIGIADAAVYRDRVAIYLPSRLLFYGWGSRLVAPGEERLAEVARLLRMLPGQVLIGESSALHPNHPLFHRPDVGLERAWTVLQHFTDRQGLPRDRFRLEACPVLTREDLREEPMVQIVLLARRVYP
jgi:chemotaxis protein MotB